MQKNKLSTGLPVPLVLLTVALLVARAYVVVNANRSRQSMNATVDARVGWLSLAEGEKRLTEEKNRIVVYAFVSKGAPASESTMDSFTNLEVVDLLHKFCIPVRLDNSSPHSHSGALAARYNVSECPTTIATTADGDMIEVHRGKASWFDIYSLLQNARTSMLRTEAMADFEQGKFADAEGKLQAFIDRHKRPVGDEAIIRRLALILAGEDELFNKTRLVPRSKKPISRTPIQTTVAYHDEEERVKPIEKYLEGAGTPEQALGTAALIDAETKSRHERILAHTAIGAALFAKHDPVAQVYLRWVMENANKDDDGYRICSTLLRMMPASSVKDR